MAEAEVELQKVRKELALVLDRLGRDFRPEDREQYARLLAREELLLLEVSRG